MAQHSQQTGNRRDLVSRRGVTTSSPGFIATQLLSQADSHMTNSQLDESPDLGFGAIVASESGRRLLNRDGTFNVRCHGLGPSVPYPCTTTC